MSILPRNPHHATAVDPVVTAENSADPYRMQLGDLWIEEARLRLALDRCEPGRTALIARLVAVEGALGGTQ